MDALRNSKKISLLAVAILFLFTYFNLILDAPRMICWYGPLPVHLSHMVDEYDGS